ncbi:hypothetical protein O6H91_18G023700 [Diphasiastrum complanatum]|uniref:Uncharacterized protein n=1 Tax=Diphasiastrum complanatum TaxID=34168 RepID=A0ACC2AYW1_DIPCM|nr:hypothetical protein O6H91_18G023700 [Diphasiastrum complanatum]
MTLAPMTTAVGPALLGAMAVAYLASDLISHRKIFGGTVPHTTSKEWTQETLKKFDEGWSREATETPIVMNPISRQNYRIQ